MPPGDGAGADTGDLFLIDAMNLIHRCYHVLKDSRMTAGDIDTRTVFSVTLSLLMLLQNYVRGARMVVVFEGSTKKGFRTQLFPEYKAQRTQTPDAIKDAVPLVRGVVEALGCRCVEVAGVEADDVIGTLTSRWQGRSVIVSNDKDFRQLVGRKGIGGGVVEILRPMRGGGYEYFDENTFEEEFDGIRPQNFIDYLALTGDASDNIPGVPGVGPVTALKAIVQYGDVETLLAKIAEVEDGAALPGVTKRITGLVKEHAELVCIYRKLVTIQQDVKLGPEFAWSELERRSVDHKTVISICDRLNFNSDIRGRMLYVGAEVKEGGRAKGRANEAHSNKATKQLDIDAPVRSLIRSRVLKPPTELDYREIDCCNVDDVNEAVHLLRVASCSDGKNTSGVGVAAFAPLADGDLKGVALCARPGVSFLFMLGESESLPLSLLEFLKDADIIKMGWSLKDTSKFLAASLGAFLGGLLTDLRIACDLLWAGEGITDGAFTSSFLGHAQVVDIFEGELTFVGVPSTEHAAYAAADAAMRIGSAVLKELSVHSLDRVARDIEFPLVPVLGRMERTGVPFNADELCRVRDLVMQKVEGLEGQILDLVPKSLGGGGSDTGSNTSLHTPDANRDEDTSNPPGKRKKSRPFSISARDDIAKLLHEVWEIPVVAKTATGKAKVDKRTLTIIAHTEGLPQEQRMFASEMLKYREMSKLATSYTSTLSDFISFDDGRIRCTFLQNASASGRLSTSSPNLQAVPVRTALGRSIRATLKARPGFSIITADYSQIELKILAAMAGDTAMTAIFEDGLDVHSAVASQIFHTASPTSSQRSRAKAVSFGIPYGISAFGLAQGLSIDEIEAGALISDFFAAYPGVKALTLDLVRRARANGFAETLYGRRLYLPQLANTKAKDRKRAERQAVNMPIQGTQADMIKIAMIRVSERLATVGQGLSELVLQVHDELVVEAEDSHLEEVVRCVREEMCQALPLPGGLQVTVNIGVGKNWQESAENSKSRAVVRDDGSGTSEQLDSAATIPSSLDSDGGMSVPEDDFGLGDYLLGDLLEEEKSKALGITPIDLIV